MKITTITLNIALLFFTGTLFAQSYTAKVIDQKTQEPILFATVQYDTNKGTITNEEGVFTIPMTQLKDSITITSMGYERLSVVSNTMTDTTLTLVEKNNELKAVFLTNNPLSPEEIIERVKENVPSNYPNALSEKKVFYRSSQRSTMDKIDIDFKKSTIEELNEQLLDSIVRAIPRRSDYYTEAVANASGNYDEQKVRIERSAKLYDKNNEVSLESFSGRLETIFKENVKPNSFIKIKSGLFGTKIQLDSTLTETDQKGTIQVKVQSDSTATQEDAYDTTDVVKDGIERMYKGLFFNEDSTLDFLSKSNRYDFETTGYTTIDDATVYIITFEPKWKKDFKGTLYVNTEDYAIMRLAYENVRNIRSIKLLGISYQENAYRGKTIFKKTQDQGYIVSYLEVEKGVRIGVDRPLKVIEKNKFVKGRNKQNELSLGIDVGTTAYDKQELIVFTDTAINDTQYKNVEPTKNIEATYLSAYDASFWDGYSIIEPNEAIQSFKALEE